MSGWAALALSSLEIVECWIRAVGSNESAVGGTVIESKFVSVGAGCALEQGVVEILVGRAVLA